MEVTDLKKDRVGAIYMIGSKSWREILEAPSIPGSHGQVDCVSNLFLAHRL